MAKPKLDDDDMRENLASAKLTAEIIALITASIRFTPERDMLAHAARGLPARR